jgi:copper homeostasis protein
VLTSGQRASAIEGAALIRDLVAAAGERIIVMPGAGVDADNIAKLRATTGAREFHASAKRNIASAMRYRSDRLVDMQTGEMRSDITSIRRLRQALDVAP